VTLAGSESRSGCRPQAADVLQARDSEATTSTAAAGPLAPPPGAVTAAQAPLAGSESDVGGLGQDHGACLYDPRPASCQCRRPGLRQRQHHAIRWSCRVWTRASRPGPGLSLALSPSRWPGPGTVGHTCHRAERPEPGLGQAGLGHTVTATSSGQAGPSH
jgi:hypothetical protein